jgi:hypothetical protein
MSLACQHPGEYLYLHSHGWTFWPTLHDPSEQSIIWLAWPTLLQSMGDLKSNPRHWRTIEVCVLLRHPGRREVTGGIRYLIFWPWRNSRPYLTFNLWTVFLELRQWWNVRGSSVAWGMVEFKPLKVQKTRFRADLSGIITPKKSDNKT